MLGYVRWELVVDQLSEVVDELADFADRDGFDLAGVHYERGPCTGALWQLVNDVAHSQIRNVVIPSRAHLYGDSVERRQLVDRLRALQVQVWCLNEDASQQRGGEECARPQRPVTGWADGGGEQLGEVFIVGPRPAAIEAVCLHVDTVLSHAGLRGLAEDVRVVAAEQVRAAVAAAQADCGPIYEAVDAQINELRIWMLRRAMTLVVVVDESREHTREPLRRLILNNCVRAGRFRSDLGGTVTWCELELELADDPLYRTAAGLLTGGRS